MDKIFHNKSVFLKLFGSYLLILGITLIVEMGVSLRVLHAGREQARTLNRSLMLLVKNECDNQVRDIYRNMDLLAFDDRVQTLSGIKGEMSSESRYTAYMLYRELQRQMPIYIISLLW